MVEAAGIEPASESRSTTASTCVVYLLNLTRRRPGKRGCRHASSNSSRSRTLERRSASQPALVGAPVGSCGRSPAERAAFSLRSHCVRIVRNYRVFPRFNEDMGPRHAAIASPPPSNPGRPHTLSPIRLAARTDENIARQPRPVKRGGLFRAIQWAKAGMENRPETSIWKRAGKRTVEIWMAGNFWRVSRMGLDSSRVLGNGHE